MSKVFLVGIGGFTGAVLRYIVSIVIPKFVTGNFPYSTIIVNTLGCLLIGILMQVGFKYGNISEEMKLFLATGVLGGLTTFSTFGYETMNLFLKDSVSLGILNIFLSLLLGLLGVWIGKILIH